MAETPSGKELAAQMAAHAQARNNEGAVMQQSWQQTVAATNAVNERLNASLETGRLAARRAVMVENELAALQETHAKLQAQHDGLKATMEPIVAEKAALTKERDALKAQVADLEKRVNEMETHPDVIAAREKAAADLKAAKVAELEAQLAQLKG